MPYYPDPAGGSMYAATEEQARSQGWTPSMGTFGQYTQNEMGAPPSGGGGGGDGGGGGGAQTTIAAQGGQQLAAGINSLLGAIASGNKEAFDEAVRQFNTTFGLDQSKFTEAVRQFNENLGLQQAGLTGTYQGQPTLAAQLQAAQQLGTYQGQQTQAAQLQAANIAAQQAGLTGTFQGQQTLAAQLQAANVAAQRAATAQNWATLYGYTPQFDAAGNPVTVGGETLEAQQQRFAQQQALAQLYGQGFANFGAVPGGQQTLAAQQQQYAQQMGMINQAAQLQANPFRQQQAIGQMGRLLGGQGVAGFSAPNTVGGVGIAGGNTQGGLGYLSQMIDDIRDPTANTQSMNQVLQGIPTPNKLNSVEFLRAAPSTQNLVLQGMQEKFGLDPNDALAQIKNTLPGFQAPSTFGQVRR